MPRHARGDEHPTPYQQRNYCHHLCRQLYNNNYHPENLHLSQFLPSFGFSNELSWTKTFTFYYSAGMILGNIGRRVEEQNQEGKTGIKVYPSSLISQESFADHHGTVIQVGPSERRVTCATAAFSGGILGANQALFPRNGQPFKWGNKFQQLGQDGDSSDEHIPEAGSQTLIWKDHQKQPVCCGFHLLLGG